VVEHEDTAPDADPAAGRAALRIARAVAENLIRGAGPGSRFEILIGYALGLTMAALVVLVGLHLAGPLMHAPPPPAIASLDGVALLPDDAVVGKVFKKLAAAELAADRNARKHFPDHRWSQQDRRAGIMRNRTRQIARHHKLPVAVIYLIHQKGIGEHWPGKNGKPLEVEIVPRKSRKW
jgi:hypothetical protein